MVFRIIPIAGFLLAVLISAGARADDETAGDDAFKNGDFQTALKLLVPLAQQGDIGAQVDLGAMYFAGHGVAQDFREAAKWFRAAAAQGNVGGQTNLGILYAAGSGVPQDDVRAYMWFSLAASQHNAGASRYRDHVAQRMTADQLQTAKDAAARCEASSYKDCGSQ
jgi:TPR repeat protein